MKQRDLLFLLISSFLLVAAWVIFNIVHTNLTSTVSDTLSGQIAPIDPNFDTKTINSLKNAKQITPLYQVSEPTPTPTPPITPINPISIQSASPVPTTAVTPIAPLGSTPTATPSSKVASPSGGTQ